MWKSFAGRASCVVCSTEPLTILMVVLHITFYCEFMECGSRWCSRDACNSISKQQMLLRY